MGMLTILFIVLKLVGVISWGWFYVFLPVIIEVSIAVLFIVISIIAGLIFNS